MVTEGVYVISVAARLLHMHPQTLRKYERVGLVIPSRTIGMLRLYSVEDIVQLKLIKYMVEDLGMNLAGVEFSLRLIDEVMELKERIRLVARSKRVDTISIEDVEELFNGFQKHFTGMVW